MSAFATPASAPVFEPDPLLHDLLAVSLTAINLLRPCYGPAGELDDFAPEYFNPAAQRMTGLLERPVGTARTLFPDIFTNGIFAFYRQVFETGEPGQFQRYYQADGLDNYFHIAARRSGERLLVSFTDTADQSRTAAENALRDSQAAEQATLAETEARQATLYAVFEQAPVAISLLQGPTHVIEFANARMAQLWGRSLAQVVGQAHFTALPELAGQGFEEILAAVWHTGEPYYLREQLVTLHRAGQPYQGYSNITYQPNYNGQGQRTGVLTLAIDVTEQVLARRQVEQLNQELEIRVQERTRQLATQQGELQRLFAQAPVGIAVFRGPTHTIEMANERQLAIWDKTPAQALGRGLFDLFPEVAGQGFEERLAGVLATGTPFVGTDVPASFTRHGVPEQVFFSFVYTPLREAEGPISGVMVVVTDTTAQVRARQQVEQLNQELEARVQERTQQLTAAQAAAERERAQLQAVLAQAPVAIGLFAGEELRVTSANAAIVTLWGRTPEQVVGHPLLEALPELQGQGFDDLLRQVLRTQVPFIGTETPALLRRAGELHTTYFNFVYQPLYEADGQVTSVLCLAVDVTEQVLARQQVEQLNVELEARVQGRTRALQTLFAQAPMALVVLRGPQFIIEQANAQAEYIWGVAAADVLGRPHFEAVPGSGGQGFEEMLTGILATGEAVVLREVLIKLARAHTGQPSDGYYNVIFKPLFDEGQPQPSGIVVMWTETTDQVLARQQVQELNEELAAINEELTATNEELNTTNTQLTRTNVDLDTFVYTASHDLKAPITNIESIVLALRSTLPAEVQQDEVVAHLLELLDTTVARFRLTIGQLTDISRLQLAHAGPAEPVRLAQVIENVRLDLEPAIAVANTQLTIEVTPELVVSFSPSNLRSIVYNLLSNAIKYRAPDRPSRVLVRAEQTATAVVLTVQDNGLGMSELQQRQLFGLFQRLHTHVEGTGVGLYISKRLVENAGGTITVQSQADAGATFTVAFPA